MADALCGPSNPLQSFAKHTQQDRSLQQDRLRSAAGPSESFRSPSQNVGALDPDFEAFQAGYQAPAAAPSFQAPLPVPGYVGVPLAKPAPQVVPDWALDFQRLNISAAPPKARAEPVAQVGPAAALSHTPQAFVPSFESSFSYLGHGYGAGVGMGYMEYQEQGMSYAGMPQQMGVPFADGGFAFDTEAFERAFDIAAAEASQLDAEAMKPESEYEALMRSEEEFDQIMSSIQADDSDQAAGATATAVPAVAQPAQDEAAQHEGANDEDKLSQTAKQLLESVSHETSDKFAQSSFLGLMRRLRDKEVHVEGEDFIESSTNAIANTTGVASAAIEEPESLISQSAGQAAVPEAVETLGPVTRPLTPEIDPPAPTMAAWKQRLMG